MIVKMQKWGNSLALRIPSSMAKQLGIQQNSFVNIVENDGIITLEPVQKPKYKLHEMLSQINENNLHEEQSFGASVGKEIW
jgi:antitoxin MazE